MSRPPRDIGTLLLVAISVCACASAPAEQRGVFIEVYWNSARECERRFATLHLDRVEQDGSVSLSAAADSRSELREFRACYHSEIAARAERRRAAGVATPPALDLTPHVELD